MMPTRKRYIISSRLGGPIPSAARATVNAFVTQRRDAKQIRSHGEYTEVLLLTEQLARELAEQAGDLVVEEDHPLRLYDQPWLPFSMTTRATHFIRVRVVDDADESAVPHVTLIGTGAWLGLNYRAETDGDGRADLVVDEPLLTCMVALPRDTYWSKISRDIVVDGEAVLIRLKRLLVTGAYDWGHRLMGFRLVNQVYAGAGIRIAVVDSGIADGSEDLRPAGGRNMLDGGDPNAWNADEQGHGTHVAGIVAALNNAVGVVGGAPAAEIYSLKVFPGGFISDVIEALDWSIENRIDIVNLSLGTAEFSFALASAINRAYLRGITCVCAVGNQRAFTSYPAAFPQTIGVSAIGRAGTFPEDSAHTRAISGIFDSYGGLFAGSFNNFGPHIDVCAPGVAILSTVPTGYAALDGTSMACPLISAFAALLLEAYPALRTGAATQVEAVRHILRTCCIDLGMPAQIQGAGLPFVPFAFGLAGG
jgi:subtilisin family serine protease